MTVFGAPRHEHVPVVIGGVRQCRDCHIAMWARPQPKPKPVMVSLTAFQPIQLDRWERI